MCERWVYDPYFQHFTGEEFFQHEFPHERSDLSHWRKRLGGKLELLLAESLRVAHESGALRTKDLARGLLDVKTFRKRGMDCGLYSFVCRLGESGGVQFVSENGGNLACEASMGMSIKGIMAHRRRVRSGPARSCVPVLLCAKWPDGKEVTKFEEGNMRRQLALAQALVLVAQQRREQIADDRA